jgi:hypothetical protein
MMLGAVSAFAQPTSVPSAGSDTKTAKPANGKNAKATGNHAGKPKANTNDTVRDVPNTSSRDSASSSMQSGPSGGATGGTSADGENTTTSATGKTEKPSSSGDSSTATGTGGGTSK